MALKAPRTAVVTGVARMHGIGRSICARFLEAGWRVVGLDMLEQEAPMPSNKGFAFLRLDVSSMQELRQLPARLAQLPEPVSQVHALINNAGIANPYMPESGGDFDALADAWQRYLDVNLTGPFLLSSVLLPLMPAGDSSIVHVSSTRAKQSEPNSEGYAASKAGLLGLTHAQAVTLARRTRVNAVLPGWIDTSGQAADTITREQREWQLTGDVGAPNDVAQLCLFLSDGQTSGYITGQHFVIDGGVTVKMFYPE